MKAGRGVGRWLLWAGLSLALHAAVGGSVGAALRPRATLPRFEVREVAGIPVPAERRGQGVQDRQDEAARDEPGAAAEPPRRAAEPPPPPPPRRDLPEGEDEVLAARAPTSQPEERVAVAAPPDAGPEGAEGDAGAEPVPLVLPEAAGRGDLSGMMAGEARVSLLVRTDLVAGAPDATSLRRTIRQVPGFRDYFGVSGFDPLTDFSWMSLRTPDPTRVELSAVAAALAVDLERGRAMVERVGGPGAGVEWAPSGGDGGPEVARLAPAPRPDGGPASRAPSRSAHLRAVAWALVEPGPLLLAGPPAWVESAAARPGESAAEARAGLEEVRLGEEEPAVVIAAADLDRLVAVEGAGLPMPSSFVMAGRFGEESLLVAELFFDRPLDATRFVREVRARVATWSAHPVARLFELPALLGCLEVEAEGPRVEARARLGRSELRRVLALARWFLAAGSDAPEGVGRAVDDPASPQ